MEEIIRLQGYETLWDEWHVDKLLYEGNLSNIYQVKKENAIGVIKVISVPKLQTESRIGGQFNEENQEAMSGFFREVVDVLENEVERVSVLNTIPNVLEYKKCQAFERKEDVGFDLILLMDKEENLQEYYSSNVKIKNEELVRIVKEVAWILERAHQEGVVHKDIKIENIFISESGEAMLADFALTRKIESYQSRSQKRIDSTYTAPEVLSEYDFNVRTDIYALGVVLYILLNDGMIPLEFSNRTFQTEIPKPVRAGERLTQIVWKAISYRAKDRYQSADELFKDLSRLTDEDFAFPAEYTSNREEKRRREKEEAERLRKLEEEEKLRLEEERKAEAEKLRREEEKKAEEERLRQEELERQKEEERLRQEELERQKKEEELRREQEEKAQEAEKARIALEEQKAEEERARKPKEEEERQAEQERRLVEEREKLRKAEEEQQRKEREERLRKQEEERQKAELRAKAEEERIRKQEEIAEKEREELGKYASKTKEDIFEEKTLEGAVTQLESSMEDMEQQKQEAEALVEQETEEMEKEKGVDVQDSEKKVSDLEADRDLSKSSSGVDENLLEQVFEQVVEEKAEVLEEAYEQEFERKNDMPLQGKTLDNQTLLEQMTQEKDGAPAFEIHAIASEYSGFFDFSKEDYHEEEKKREKEPDKSMYQEPYEHMVLDMPKEPVKKAPFILLLLVLVVLGVGVFCWQNADIRGNMQDIWQQIQNLTGK